MNKTLQFIFYYIFLQHAAFIFILKACREGMSS